MAGCSQTLGWLAAFDKLKAAHARVCRAIAQTGRRCLTVKPPHLKLFHAKASLRLACALPNCRKTMKLGAKLNQPYRGSSHL